MNKFFVVVAVGGLALFGACQKQQTEAERNADVEREVQARLAAERQAAEQQQLAERQDQLDAQLRELGDQQRATTTPEPERSPEQRTTEPLAESAGASYSMFYTRLEPHGAWLETPTYGYVWQPRSAMDSRTWRPYTNGQWVYTDAGWTWISEEPFGWATYHYGRWTRLRGIGWVWVPGDEWASAWVSWRTSNDYVGWAPLPPEARFEARVGIHSWSDNYYEIGPEQYCFVPTREIGSERIERVVVPPEQNVTIVSQTTNVTNITYNNTIIVNQGPNYDELRARTQRPIQRLRLERRTTVETENPRLVVRGEVVEVPAPVLARAQSVERPPVVKQKITQVEVDRGWEGVGDQRAAQQARAKIKSEATPPPNAPPKTFVKPAPVAGRPRAVSPAPRATAAPVTRSTITPAPTPAAASPAQTPAPPRATRPAVTTSPPVAASPRSTAARPVRATATPVATAMPTATPAATTTPFPRFTPAATPRPAFSPTPAATPAFSATPQAQPPLGRTETRKQRRAEKELRKQERTERKSERLEAATPTPAATATPPTAAAPPVAPARPPGKEHKKHKRPGEAEASPTATPVASP
jgi:hypothetical protein